ncbi:MAG: S-adenosylmethionine:tRNA ribosyltransferase-isomerase [Candidatus Elarobacter sp.]
MMVEESTSFVLPARNEATTTPERRGIARDDVRLLVTDRSSGGHRDASFRDLPAFLRAGDLLVANDSATLPAALRAQRADGEAFALHLSTRIADALWIAEPRAAQPVAAGERVALAGRGEATFLAPVDDAHPRLWYTGLTVPQPFDAFLSQHGAPVRYPYVVETLPLADYQTVFARVPGSAEMPSAARPFTLEALDDLHEAGVALATVTLHTGVSSPERHERPYRGSTSCPPRPRAR